MGNKTKPNSNLLNISFKVEFVHANRSADLRTIGDFVQHFRDKGI
jgi:hypothetical protein